MSNIPEIIVGRNIFKTLFGPSSPGLGVPVSIFQSALNKKNINAHDKKTANNAIVSIVCF